MENKNNQNQQDKREDTTIKQGREHLSEVGEKQERNKDFEKTKNPQPGLENPSKDNSGAV